MLVSTDVHAINSGTEAATCEWPSVVYLRVRGSGTAYDICSGVYIGGRVVLTAAHCDDGNGLYYNYEELHEYAGLVPFLGGSCTSDAQCPSVTIEGTSTDMKCDDEVGEHPSPDGSCYLDDEELDYTNFAVEARFGEAYEEFATYGSEQPYNAIPIQYCKVYDHVNSGMGFEPGDFAYCILAEEPDVEPVPLLMHCEVDEFLDGAYTLDVAAVGFGIAAPMGIGNESGRKRWSTEFSRATTKLELGIRRSAVDHFHGRPRPGVEIGLGV